MKLIKNGVVVNQDQQFKADILIDGAKIVDVATTIEISNDVEVIDATNCYVMPGFIDPHTHFDLDTGTTRSVDDFSSGTKAAICGGTTTIIDFATQDKNMSLKEAYDKWLAMAQDKSSCNYRFHMAISDWNEDTKKEISEMPKLGVTSFKMYMAYDNLYAKDDEIFECLQEVKKINGLLGVHCENGLLIKEMIKELKEKNHLDPSAHPLSRPSEIEAEAINRLLTISKLVDYPVMIVHLSSKEGLNEIEQARAQGLKVYTETCPQYLFLDDSKYSLPNFEGAKYVLSPPIRKQIDNQILIQAIIDNKIQTIATDHCSFSFEKQKKLGIADFSKIPNGAPGVETRALLIYSNLVRNGSISLTKMVEILSTNAAKLYDIYPKKGVIQVGSDADIVVFSPESKSIIEASKQKSKADYSLFEKEEIFGSIKNVLLNGDVVVVNGDIIKENTGMYVRKENE